MSDNYYQFLSDMNTPQGIAQDAQVMREHPDGSPCYAKREEDCPIMNKAKKADNADDLGNGGAAPAVPSESSASQAQPQTTEGRHLSELVSTLQQIKKWVPNSGDLKYSHLEEAYVDLSEQIDAWQPPPNGVEHGTRTRRDEIFGKHPKAEYESFDLTTGEKVKDEDAAGKWGVTFHTTSAETKGDDEYDTNVARFASILNAKPQVGVYEGSCEISYNCPSLTLAAAAMVKCEQKAIFGNMMGKRRKRKYGIDIVNYTFDQKINDLEHPEPPKKRNQQPPQTQA